MDGKVLDGAALVNMLPPKQCKTYDEYARTVPYIVAQIQEVERLDIVWDPTSLKQSARERRDHNACKRVTAKATVPGNWQNFLRSDDNKRELFTFLAVHVESIHIEGKLLVSSCAEDILSSCNHEEADTRVFVHVVHAANSGHGRATICTVDTYIVVVAVANMHKMQNVRDLWLTFGTGKVFQVYTMSLHCKSIQQDNM